MVRLKVFRKMRPNITLSVLSVYCLAGAINREQLLGYIRLLFYGSSTHAHTHAHTHTNVSNCYSVLYIHIYIYSGL